MTTKYLLIGGGLASHEAAKELRRLEPEASITLVSDEPHLPYNRPPLSKQFVSGKMPRERLFFGKPGFYADSAIETVLSDAVVKLDPQTLTATTASGLAIRFERALIATGGTPIRLALPGSDLPGVCELRTLDDAEAIAGAAKEGGNAVIVGGGFVGLEIAAFLTDSGMSVTIIEREDRIWKQVADEDVSTYVQRFCEGRGITFRFGETVTEFAGDTQLCGVRTEKGDEIPADLVCVGIGIRANADLASDAGLEVDNGIVVDAHLRSSHPAIWSVGDVSKYPDAFSGRMRRVEHWGHARFGGICAARNMAGQEEIYETLSYVWSDIFDLKVNAAGDSYGADSCIVRRYEDGSFAQLFVRDGVLAGCLTVGTPVRLFGSLKQLITKRFVVAGHEDALADSATDLLPLARGG
ncbi:MAG: 3-phenylpropionate/trans-cinnamate dioxygenase ferredoxin reductase subunit [Rhodothermales bacterium]|jgi:3-phenylpropionate/trans-cinnamate dioxygenase ferredoxin reductase subunit